MGHPNDRVFAWLGVFVCAAAVLSGCTPAKAQTPATGSVVGLREREKAGRVGRSGGAGGASFGVPAYAGLPDETGIPRLAGSIWVDQFGYRPEAQKIAIFSESHKGQSPFPSAPPGKQFTVVSAETKQIVFKGQLVPWNDRKISELSGDRVWFADFSEFKKPGRYYIEEPNSRFRSFDFTLQDDVYVKVMNAATKMFYYNRANTPIPEKFGGAWNHKGGHLGPSQDKAARYIQGGKPQGRPKDLTGGWYDAGDYTKYIPFLSATLFNLFFAYERNPSAFPDNTGIPESGNGIPDLLDELRWELNWTLKMQDADGGVHNRNGSATHDTGELGPDTDPNPRFYTAKTTWATATAVASWAQAAYLFQKIPALRSDASRLKSAALLGWKYLEAKPNMDPPSGRDGDETVVSAKAESDANGDRRARIYAAAALYRLTGGTQYAIFVEKNVTSIGATEQNGLHPLKGDWKSVDPLNAMEITQALYLYAKAQGPNKQLVEMFKSALSNTSKLILDNTGGADDPYLNFMYPGHYTWGSNNVRCLWGRVLIMATDLQVLPPTPKIPKEVIAGYAHFIHGRNPLGWCYLSNMSKAGATLSVNSIYHSWFKYKSDYDGAEGGALGPPPGYLAGGPNGFFSVKRVAPPYGEPPMKAYKNWSRGWNNEAKENDASWEITEPAIYYQAAYVLVLSEAMRPAK